VHRADRAAAGQATRTGRTRAGSCARAEGQALKTVWRADARSRGAKKRCATQTSMPIEPLGRGNSEPIVSGSLFAVDLELGAFQYWDGGR
jgi:hypothetical protein